MNVKKDGTEPLLACSCGHRQRPEKTSMKEKVSQPKKIDVVTDTIHPLAVYSHKCKKCGYGKAQVISRGIWYSDEDEVIEYVCGKCGCHEKDPDQKIG